MQNRLFSVSLNGKTPIAFNNPNCRPPKGMKMDTDKWEEEHWMERLYRDDEGKVFVPIKILRKAALEVCSLLDLKPTFGKLKSYRMPIEDTWFFKGAGAKLEFDSKQLIQWREYVNPNPKSFNRGGAGVLRIRPMILAPWSLGFTLQTIHDAFTFKVVEEILSGAYLLKGIGEGRKYAGYGRAEVSIVEVEE